VVFELFLPEPGPESVEESQDIRPFESMVLRVDVLTAAVVFVNVL